MKPKCELCSGFGYVIYILDGGERSTQSCPACNEDETPLESEALEYQPGVDFGGES